MSALYHASVPVFAKTLGAMKAWLDKAEAFAAEKKFETSVFCVARLAPDMLSLSGQFHLATAFAKNAACRLAGKTPPDFPSLEDSFTAYRARIEETLRIVSAVEAHDFAGAETREMNIQVGPDMRLDFTGESFLNTFILPNFYFHSTMAYALLRHNGAPLGKLDFMGAQP